METNMAFLRQIYLQNVCYTKLVKLVLQIIILKMNLFIRMNSHLYSRAYQIRVLTAQSQQDYDIPYKEYVVMLREVVV